MTVTLDLTEDATFTVLTTFLTGILDSGVELVQGQDNRVPEPAGDNFVEMVGITYRRLTTNVETWTDEPTDPLILSGQVSMDWNIRLDVHGGLSADNANIIAMAWRSNYAVDILAATGLSVSPLYADDPQQAPFINESQQYENRWIVTLHMQVDPIISTPQDFADTVTVDLVSVDAAYPPGANE